MSRNILDELYDYDLFHLTEIEDMDVSYKKALDRLVKAEAGLKKAYPDSTEILDEYQSADIELHNLSNRNEFRKGFKVGAQLVLEMIKPILSIHLTQLLVTSDLKRQIGAFTAASARRSKRVS